MNTEGTQEKPKYVVKTRRIDFNKKKNWAKVRELIRIYGDVDNIPIEFLQSRTVEKYCPKRHKDVK